MSDRGRTTPRFPSFRIIDSELRSAFGLDGDEQWMRVLRRASQSVSLGSLGPYELLEEAGRGGQGAVYKAAHRGTGRIVALKRLPLAGAASPMARARFEREIEAACALDHPSVVTVYSAEVIDGHAVIAMEWVNGLAIDRWASSAARPVEQVVSVFLQVCDGVAHAHQRGVIHRDLKPSNIMVGADGRPRILDFGLAKLVDGSGPDDSITRLSGFVGTPAYAAPEQIAGAPADTRSDVYALGIVLHTLLAGGPPFDTRAGVAAVFDQVRGGVSRPPSAGNPAVGRELDAIVLKACALEPHARYHSAEAFADDLRRFLSGQVVAAHPPTTMYRLRKAARRHRAASAAIGTGLVLLVVFTAVASVMSIRLAVQRRALVKALGSEHAALLRAESAKRDEAAARAAAEASTRSAKAATARARTSARRSATSLEFLGEILQEAGGGRDPRPDVPMRDVLTRAVSELDAGRLADQPEAEMDLRLTIGRSYFSLGLYEQAEPQMRTALALAERLHGPKSRAVARALDFLGRLLELDGRLLESEELERRGLAVQAALSGTNSVDYAGALSDLASVVDERGRYAEAEAIYTLALQIRSRSGNTDPARTATVVRNIGLEQYEQGRYADAERATTAALDQIERMGRVDTDAWFRARRNLAMIYSATGRAAAAVAIQTDVIERWASQIGPDHPQIGHERALLAGMLVRSGDLERGLSKFAVSLSGLSAKLPAHHPWIVRTRLDMAAALADHGRPEDAIPLAAMAVDDIFRAAPGSERLVVYAAAELARCQSASGQDDEAVQTLYAAAARLAARLGPGDECVQRCLRLAALADAGLLNGSAADLSP